MTFFNNNNKPEVLASFDLVESLFKQDTNLIKLKKNSFFSIENDLPYSFIKIGNTVCALAPGKKECIGTGEYARVKEGIDRNGNRYAIKIASKQTACPENEKKITQELGLLLGQAERFNSNGKKKDYSLMPHLGDNLFTILKTHQLSLSDRIQLAIQVCVEVDKLHKLGYMHGDLKPENVTLTKEGKANLIDYGFSEHINPEQNHFKKVGTWLYLPITEDGLDGLGENLDLLKHIGIDIFALKRTLFLSPTISPMHIDPEKHSILGQVGYNLLPTRLQTIIDTVNVNPDNNKFQAFNRREDTAAYLAACLIWYSKHLNCEEAEFNQFEEEIKMNVAKQEELITEFKQELKFTIEKQSLLANERRTEEATKINQEKIKEALTTLKESNNPIIEEKNSSIECFLNLFRLELKSNLCIKSATDINLFIEEARKNLIDSFLKPLSDCSMEINKLDKNALPLILLIFSFSKETQTLVNEILKKHKAELETVFISRKDPLLGISMNFCQNKQAMQKYVSLHTTPSGQITINPHTLFADLFNTNEDSLVRLFEETVQEPSISTEERNLRL